MLKLWAIFDKVLRNANATVEACEVLGRSPTTLIPRVDSKTKLADISTTALFHPEKPQRCSQVSVPDECIDEAVQSIHS
ncbi:hypothetical protein [Gemmatimonas sp. UBA7669]|uniref:hypothetical protein n=1 Tax=Gemmatimonas sp. UBA7669 TaxID=1946568 RepID=UPI0025C11AC2|nr:hypothetical protein [Gemmatimonas sp. UBA7669]